MISSATAVTTSSYDSILLSREGVLPGNAEEVIALLEMSDPPTETVRVLDMLLPVAVEQVERFTNLSLTISLRQVVWGSLGGSGKLPYGPVHANPVPTVTYTSGSVSVNDTTGQSLISGGTFPRLSGRYPSGVSVSYKAGYNPDPVEGDGTLPLPESLKMAVLVCAAELYCTNTGFQVPQKLTNNWRTIAAPFRRF